MEFFELGIKLGSGVLHTLDRLPFCGVDPDIHVIYVLIVYVLIVYNHSCKLSHSFNFYVVLTRVGNQPIKSASVYGLFTHEIKRQMPMVLGQ